MQDLIRIVICPFTEGIAQLDVHAMRAGTIARTCAATRVGLHLVGPLGFEIDNSRLKRAGLDYWPYVTVKVHDTWGHFVAHYSAQTDSKRLLAFSKAGTMRYSSAGAAHVERVMLPAA